MTASTAKATIAKIDAASPQSAREPELIAALDNIKQLLSRHNSMAAVLLRSRMLQAWLIAEKALR